MDKSQKILPANYGSIPHLSISKLTQQADKKISEGEEIILTKKARDWRDLIIVTEKLDGSNVGVIRMNDELIPITRAGYTAISSPYEQHHKFHFWVKNNNHLFLNLPEGWRICGEWMYAAHGTIYDISGLSPFVAFDLINSDNERSLYLDFLSFCWISKIQSVPMLHIGQPVSIENCIKLMGSGNYGHAEKPEGFVYRCEREGKVNFLAKYVRSDKEDGKYLDSNIINKGINF